MVVFDGLLVFLRWLMVVFDGLLVFLRWFHGGF